MNKIHITYIITIKLASNHGEFVLKLLKFFFFFNGNFGRILGEKGFGLNSRVLLAILLLIFYSNT